MTNDTKTLNAGDGKSLGGPVIDQTPHAPARTPVDSRWNDRDISTKLQPRQFTGGTSANTGPDAYDYPGRTGEK